MELDENLAEKSNTCYCLIPRPNRVAFMIVKEDEKWVLPSLPYTGEWIESTFTKIGDQILSRYGLRVTVLRRLQRGKDFVFCELEVHRKSGDTSYEARWYDFETHKKSGGLGAKANEYLDQWFLDRTATELPIGRPPWEHTGWFTEAMTWIKGVMAQHSIRQLGAPKQAKVGAFSCVLSIPSDSGTLFFKASLGDKPSETLITRELGSRWPTSIMPLLETNPSKNWMLMKDYRSFGFRTLKESEYADAARGFSELLINTNSSLEQWREMNCPDFSLDQIEAFSREFSQRTGLFESGGAPMEKDELEMLVKFVEEMGARCSSLAAFKIPDMLGNLDFRLGNIAGKKNRFIYFDWQESVITHPFFSVLNMFDGFSKSDFPGLGEAVQDSQLSVSRLSIQNAFLEPFTEFEPTERLEEAFEIAKQIQPVVQLKRSIEKLEKLEQGSFWFKELTVNMHAWSKYYITK